MGMTHCLFKLALVWKVSCASTPIAGHLCANLFQILSLLLSSLLRMSGMVDLRSTRGLIGDLSLRCSGGLGLGRL